MNNVKDEPKDDFPSVYLIILISTIGYGIAAAIVFLKGW
jgi:hypothetical protein